MKISIVCPFYNEELVIEQAVNGMIEHLKTTDLTWELILVNDGSRDTSPAIVEKIAAAEDRVTLVSYPNNQGRGFALRTGVAAAQSDFVVTTEVDGSWGYDIIERMAEYHQAHPEADIIIASPHLKGGGYRNVPYHRVMLSTMGNYIIRAGLTQQITMNTGMTRGYKTEKYLELPLFEKGKEGHLEILNKALAYNFNIQEIPAILEWKQEPKAKADQPKRKSSTKIRKTIRSHFLFSLTVSPFQYIFPISIVTVLIGSIFLGWAFYNLFTPVPSVYLAIIGLTTLVFGFLIFMLGILGQQNRYLQREIWDTQRMLKNPDRKF